MLNQIVLVGRLSKINNNEMLRDETQRRFTRITLAVPRNYKNENGEYDTDYIRIKLMGVVAENTIEYCKKGDLVGIKGRIETYGENNIMEIIAEKVTFLSTKKEN